VYPSHITVQLNAVNYCSQLILKPFCQDNPDTSLFSNTYFYKHYSSLTFTDFSLKQNERYGWVSKNFIKVDDYNIIHYRRDLSHYR